MKRVLRFLGLAALCCVGLNALAANVAKVGTQEYDNIDEAMNAWVGGTTLTLLADVQLTATKSFPSSDAARTLNLSTFMMTAAANKHAIQITNGGIGSTSYRLTINADSTNPGGITTSSSSKYAVYYSNTLKDRVGVIINGGVFNGGAIYMKTGGGTKAGAVQLNGGTFNGGINFDRENVTVSGGRYNGSFQASVDSSTPLCIKGGSFKNFPVTTYSADLPMKMVLGSSVGLAIEPEVINANPELYPEFSKFNYYNTSSKKWVYPVDKDGNYMFSRKPTYNAYVYVGSDAYFYVESTNNLPSRLAAKEFEASVTKNDITVGNHNTWRFTTDPNVPVYYVDAAIAITHTDVNKAITFYKPVNVSRTNFKGAEGNMFTVNLENDAVYSGEIGFTGGYAAIKTVEGNVITYTARMPVAQIGENKYQTLAEAISAADGSEAITLLNKVTESGLEITAGKSVVIETNGKAIAPATAGATVFKLGRGAVLTVVGAFDAEALCEGPAAYDLVFDTSVDGQVTITSKINDTKCQAVIVDEDGNAVYYPTFADAVKDAAEKGTVSVNREIAAGEEVVIANKEVTLDLAGQVVKADILFTGDAQDFIIDSVGGGKVLGTISVAEGCTLKIYAGTFAQEIPAEWIAAEDAEGNPLCVIRQDDGTFKVIANKVEVKEIEITEENVEIVDEKGEPVAEEKKEAAQAAVIEANTKLQEAVAKVPPVDTGIEKASKEPVVTPSGEVVAGPAKSGVVGALQEALKEAAKTEDIPVEAVNQITATSDISERLEIRFDSEVSKVKDVTISGEPTTMEADLEVVIWDVKPIVKTVITIGEGESAEEKIIETQLPDEEVKKNPVTFRLAVSDPNATGAYVRHIGHGEYDDETIFCKVQGQPGARYVELTVDHFSLFEVRTTGEIVEELDDAIGIINLGVPDAGKELAAGVPFTTAGTAAKLDNLVMTGLASGD